MKPPIPRLRVFVEGVVIGARSSGLPLVLL